MTSAISPYVYVTSANHSYDDPHQPIGKQWPRTAPVYIGSGSWLGAGALILPGARLGRNVVVAAGSVVRGKSPITQLWPGPPPRWSASGARKKDGSLRFVRLLQIPCLQGSLLPN